MVDVGTRNYWLKHGDIQDTWNSQNHITMWFVAWSLDKKLFLRDILYLIHQSEVAPVYRKLCKTNLSFIYGNMVWDKNCEKMHILKENEI